MGNGINGYVGYGLILAAECVPGKFYTYGSDWKRGLMQKLYPEGASGLEFACHYCKEPTGKYDQPLLLIEHKCNGTGGAALEQSYDVTGSSDNPSDLSPFLNTLAKCKEEWDARIAEFVRRCEENSI